MLFRSTCAVLVKSSLGKQFDFPTGISNGEDVAYFAKIFFSATVYYTQKPTAVTLWHEDSLRHNIEELKKNSQEILDAYLEASEPVVKAEEKANEMISRAELLAKEIRLGSIEYAEDVLTTVEHNLKSILQEVERNRIELNPGK